MARLFTPVSFGPLTLANRIVVAPMCQYASSEGRANDWHVQHWGTLSQSGAGLLLTEATASCSAIWISASAEIGTQRGRSSSST